MSNTTKYEVVGTLTHEQAEQVAELLAGSSVIWCDGHTYPCDGVVIRPVQARRQYLCTGCGKLIQECSCSPLGKRDE